MKKTWYSFFLLILVLAIIKPINTNYELTSLMSVLLHSIFMIIILMKYKNVKLKFIFVAGFLTRLFLVFWDIYASKIFLLPNAGTDDLGFYKSAVLISQNLSLLNNYIYGGLYAKTIGMIFYLTGPSRILGGYINVLLGISVIFISLKIFRLLNINEKNLLISLVILAFFPNSLIMSAIFRREMMITYLVTHSLYYFVKWFLYGNNIDVLLSILLVLVGSILHSGIIGIIAGYGFAYIFYKRSEKRYVFSAYSTLYFLIISIFLVVAYSLFGDQFMAKFGDLNDVDDIIYASNLGGGGARYLENLKIATPAELILYTPIKMFYFLFSPIPWDWRGLQDALTFLIDSSFYLWCSIYFLKNNKKFTNQNEPLIKIFLISLLACIFIFGIGVGNAGTAMRHRQKLISIFVVFFVLMIEESRVKKAM